jgi:hypothetical protein
MLLFDVRCLSVARYTFLVLLHYLVLWYIPNDTNEAPFGSSASSRWLIGTFYFIQIWYPAAVFALTCSDMLCLFSCSLTHGVPAAGYFRLVMSRYLYLSAKQIRHGYLAFSTNTPIPFDADSLGHGLIPRYMFKIYLNLPFVFEMKSVWDWTFSETSLDIFMWLQVVGATEVHRTMITVWSLNHLH